MKIPITSRLGQLQIKRDHKQLCFDRAIERANYYAANIFCAQRDYYDREIARETAKLQINATTK